MTIYGKVLACLSVFDLAFTLIGIHFEFVSEWNPIMASILADYGVAVFSFIHLLCAGLFIVLLEYLWQTEPDRRLRWRLYYLFINYAYVIVLFSVLVAQPLYCVFV